MQDGTSGFYSLPDSFREDLVSQSEWISHLELIRFYDLLVRVEEEMRLHHNPHLHLEMALMGLVELAGLSDLEEVSLQAAVRRIGQCPVWRRDPALPRPRSGSGPDGGG